MSWGEALQHLMELQLQPLCWSTSLQRLVAGVDLSPHCMAAHVTSCCCCCASAELIAADVHVTSLSACVIMLSCSGVAASGKCKARFCHLQQDKRQCAAHCRGLFATHYHRLADAHEQDPKVAICHMGCSVEPGTDGGPEQVSLVKLMSPAVVQDHHCCVWNSEVVPTRHFAASLMIAHSVY